MVLLVDSLPIHVPYLQEGSTLNKRASDTARSEACKLEKEGKDELNKVLSSGLLIPRLDRTGGLAQQMWLPDTAQREEVSPGTQDIKSSSRFFQSRHSQDHGCSIFTCVVHREGWQF